jgi:transposase InsO family protein
MGWPVAKALPDARSETIADFIYRRIYSDYGPPRVLLSDNGENLLASVVTHLLKLLQTKHKLTTPYHPRANGKVENLNGTLGDILIKMCMGELVTTWDLYLESAVWATRIRKHAVHGYSPYYLVYGRHPPMPSTDIDAVEPDDTDLNELIARIVKVCTARDLSRESLLAKAVRVWL